MTSVTVTADLDHPPAQVWAIVGDFLGLGDWMPGIARWSAELEGKRRRLVLPDGGVVVEDETSRDDRAMTYSYKVVEAPMPWEAYTSTIAVAPKGDGCRVRWVGDFTPVGDEDEVADLVRGIYRAGLKAVAARLSN